MVTNFGNVLKEQRKIKGMTQKDVCSIMGIKREVLSGYENNKRNITLSRAIILAKILDVDLNRVSFIMSIYE